MSEAPDNSCICIGFDHLNLSATSDDHKVALNRLAKIVVAYFRSGAVRVHLVRARIGSLEDFAIGSVGLHSAEIPLSVRRQPPDRRKGQPINSTLTRDHAPKATLNVATPPRVFHTTLPTP